MIFERLKCWWRGHRHTSIKRGCPECYEPWPEYERMTFYFEGMRGYLRDRWECRQRRIREWWRCPDCGSRFGRHDESVDHLPF